MYKNIDDLKDDINYVAHAWLGRSYVDINAKPCPSIEIFEKIGENGVEFICDEMKRLMKNREEMFKELYVSKEEFRYGFEHIQNFYSKKINQEISVQIIEEFDEGSINDWKDIAKCGYRIFEDDKLVDYNLFAEKNLLITVKK